MSRTKRDACPADFSVALGHLRAARRELRRAGAKKTLLKIASAIKSAEGAARHAANVAARHRAAKPVFGGVTVFVRYDTIPFRYVFTKGPACAKRV